MIDTLTKYLFKYAGKCNCNGLPADKYARAGYIVYVRPKSYKFTIKQFNRMIIEWLSLSELETQLKKVHEFIEMDTPNSKATN